MGLKMAPMEEEQRVFPNQGKWVASQDPENWSPTEEWDTEAEAVAGAPGVLGLVPGESFYVGRVSLVDVRTYEFFKAEAIIDGARDVVSDTVGDDAADGFLDEATPSMERDLELRFQQTFIAWMEEHGLRPRIFTIEGVVRPRLFEKEIEKETEKETGP